LNHQIFNNKPSKESDNFYATQEKLPEQIETNGNQTQ